MMMGIGNLTELILEKKRVVCLDYEKFYVDRLDESYGHLLNFKVTQADLTKIDDIKTALGDTPVDSTFCINVAEHIEDDELVFENFHKVLKPGGHAVILVPHNPKLYSAVDKTLGHFRRYTREELSGKLEKAGFEIVSCKGFNRVGGLGWRISGKILRKKTLSAGQMRVFEWVMPLVKILEVIPFHSHNSVIAIAKKPE